MDGKTCKRGSKVAPIVLARISMCKNQARVAQEKEKEASDRKKIVTEKEILACAMEEESKRMEKVAKRGEEKTRVKERIAKRSYTTTNLHLLCHGFFLLFFCIF